MPRDPLEVDEDRAAVRRCLAGSMDAFEPIVRRHSGRLVRLAYHFLGDWDEARDLTQDAFARAYRSLDQYQQDRPIGPWLCAIAARLATDRLRRRRTAARASSRTRPLFTAGLDADARLGLSEALGRLTARQRQAVVLCDLHGFSAQESASILGCSASTVRVLRFLARRRLRDLIVNGPDPAAGQGHDPEDPLPVVAENRR
jgi:RNA polymerase sigma-70 factor (ECF subfamily)